MEAGIFEYAAKEKGLKVGALGLTRSVLKGAVLLLGALVVLSNLFAGFHIIAAGLTKVGDCVQLDSGQAGYVDDNRVALVPDTRARGQSGPRAISGRGDGNSTQVNRVCETDRSKRAYCAFRHTVSASVSL